MGITKRTITDYLILSLFAVFPLGQLPGIFLANLFNISFRAHPLDVIIIFIVIFTINLSDLYRIIIKYRYLFAPLLFSAIAGLFSGYSDFSGFLYLVRLVFYIFILLFYSENPLPEAKAKVISKALLIMFVVVAIFGWGQYLLIPDLVSLKYFGWDDHYFRLTSTFLDPAFTGIILSIATLFSVYWYLATTKKSYLILSLFFILTLGFTYSRASMLAILTGLVVMLIKKQKKLLFMLATILLVMVPLLPRGAGGEGVRLARTSSALQKIQNYSESLKIVTTSPLFGVGYNNVCTAKAKLNINISKQQNSCSGLDNSFLFILSTTGIVGSFGFIYLATSLYKYLASYKVIFASLASIFIHSLFTNTLFYSWVLVIIIFMLRGRKALRSKL